MKDLRIAGLVNDSITDGKGLRLTVFTQGCPHHCEGCHNEHTWEYEAGTIATIDSIVAKVKGNPLLSGITLSGGEPFAQAEGCYYLASEVKKLYRDLDVVVYSGYTFEQLKSSDDEYVVKLLQTADVLIDGKFEQSKKNIGLKFRGSSNQRILCLVSSLREQRAVLLDDEAYADVVI